MLPPAVAEVPFPPLSTKEEVSIHESCPNKTHNLVTEKKDFRCSAWVHPWLYFAGGHCDVFLRSSHCAQISPAPPETAMFHLSGSSSLAGSAVERRAGDSH